ncbi:HET domain-containing protein [Fusarium keratoplasticum]|uniref:HET domain-containing protein n=1 Tax=Fusarium keratoplasticum TaxID=1328300 RepID=A0ACC0RDB3_9HYPO|nr:HET domain-containing protein [Fusarium keratoplasticum]KAI8683435.1 HET domain-containing protein [Fusarium keratoplasticum]KAI8687555.1 HET domain-containing protein [Fusarium keratoplasticum]
MDRSSPQERELLDKLEGQNLTLGMDGYERPRAIKYKDLYAFFRPVIDGDASSAFSSSSEISLQGEWDRDTNCEADCWLKAKEVKAFLAKDSLARPRSEPLHEAASGAEAAAKLYTPLSPGWIRVVVLDPGEGDTPLQCTLLPELLFDPSRGKRRPGDVRDARLIKWTHYEAVSYHWGSPILSRIVLCREARLSETGEAYETPEVAMPVTASLFEALRCLRLKDRPRLLWIDGLCINQYDTAEKNRQVKKMFEIYRLSRRVVVHLGATTKGTHLGMVFLDYVNSEEIRELTLHRVHEPECIETLRVVYAGLHELLCRPWFERSWIRQEIIGTRGSIVCCGTKTIRWTSFKRGYRRLRSLEAILESHLGADFKKPALLQPRIRILKGLKRSWSAGEPMMHAMVPSHSIYSSIAGGILELLVVSKFSEASDPRDKVYSLLGLARPIRRAEGTSHGPERDSSGSSTTPALDLLSFEVDYSKSLTAVYQYLVKFVINGTKTLDILALIRRPYEQPRPYQFASWVPDWQSCTPNSIVSITDSLVLIHQRLPADFLTSQQSYEEDDILRISGWHVASVMLLTGYTASFEEMNRIDRDLPHDFNLEEIHRVLDEMSFQDWSPTDTWRCCLLDPGRIALVPSAADVGDSVFIVKGSRFPLLMRPVYGFYDQKGATASEIRWEYVGVCLMWRFSMAGAVETSELFSTASPMELVVV